MLLKSSVEEGGLWPLFLRSILVGALSCLWLLLLPFVDTIGTLEGGPRPPYSLKNLLGEVVSFL